MTYCKPPLFSDLVQCAQSNHVATWPLSPRRQPIILVHVRSEGKLGHLPKSGDLGPCPELLRTLFTSESKRAKDFRDKIRSYNSALSFVSFGATLETPVGAGRGPPVCVLHGALYHHSYTLQPLQGQPPKFAQLYMYDHAEVRALLCTDNDNMFACIDRFKK